MRDEWARPILDFWFGDLTREDWFGGGPAVDERIRSGFFATYEKLAANTPPEAMTTPKAALAAIIALDQFPRNMFRGTAKAFATDPAALALSRNAYDRNFDRDMNEDERIFLALPLMHSENLADQERCVEIIARTGNENSLKFAIEHRDIVERFGRFPHRNRALGRTSTDEEKAFLQTHEGYGQ